MFRCEVRVIEFRSQRVDCVIQQFLRPSYGIEQADGLTLPEGSQVYLFKLEKELQSINQAPSPNSTDREN